MVHLQQQFQPKIIKKNFNNTGCIITFNMLYTLKSVISCSAKTSTSMIIFSVATMSHRIGLIATALIGYIL
jgi:hypothetical protein